MQISLQPLKNNKYRIFKSRYDSIDSYLSYCGEKYNDIDLTIDDEIYQQLLDAGIHKKKNWIAYMQHKNNAWSVFLIILLESGD